MMDSGMRTLVTLTDPCCAADTLSTNTTSDERSGRLPMLLDARWHLKATQSDGPRTHCVDTY